MGVYKLLSTFNNNCDQRTRAGKFLSTVFSPWTLSFIFTLSQSTLCETQRDKMHLGHNHRKTFLDSWSQRKVILSQSDLWIIYKDRNSLSWGKCARKAKPGLRKVTALLWDQGLVTTVISGHLTHLGWQCINQTMFTMACILGSEL